MARLVVTCIRGGLNGQRFEFDQDHVTIGRKQINHVAFDPARDRKASGNHAELRRDGHQWFLKDLASTNGTFVGGGQIQGEVQLQDGVNVEFGKDGPILHFRIVLPMQPTPEAKTVLAEAPSVDVPKTMMASSSDELVAPPSSGRTAIYRAMMQETVKRSSSKLKLMLLGLSLVLLAAAIGGVLYIRAQRAETRLLKEQAADAKTTSARLADRTAELETQLETQAEALTSARTRLATTSGKLSSLRLQISKSEGAARATLERQAAELEQAKEKYESQLQRQEKQLAELKRTGHAAEDIAQKYEKSLFMLIAKTPDRLVGFCTAFAVNTDGLLATNAHCVRNIATMSDQGITTLARMNRDASRTYRVTHWRSHSGYNNTAFSQDVAVVKLDLKGQKLPVAVGLAPDSLVHNLSPGRAVYTMGFPGRVMNESRPAADFRAAVISRLTTYENAPGDADTARVVWHSALTSKGTSGSPIFNADGLVVAVNNGGLSARRVYTKDAVTGALKSDFAYDATGLNFGIRVDTLREVMQ